MTAIRINLLPHRQLRRAREQRMFVVAAVFTVGVALAIIALGQVWIMNAKSNQEARNAFLQAEIAKLDAQIAEIRQFREKTQDLLSRKDVVESLQANRGESVRLYDELMRRVPDGLYLKSIKQTGDMVALAGYAQSSARVSTFMRQLEAAPLFGEPQLIEVKAAQVGALRVNEFSLNVQMQRLAESERTTP